MVTPGVKSIISRIVETCPICTVNNPSTRPPRGPHIRSIRPEKHILEKMQVDFTVMLRASGNFRYLLVLRHTFSGWVGVFSAGSQSG